MVWTNFEVAIAIRTHLAYYHRSHMSNLDMYIYVRNCIMGHSPYLALLPSTHTQKTIEVSISSQHVRRVT